jgi:hypothetical protein
MSENKQKEVYLDFDNTIDILKKRGLKVTLDSTAKEIGYTGTSIVNLRKKAPKSVAMVHKYLKDNFLKFEDLVRER